MIFSPRNGRAALARPEVCAIVFAFGVPLAASASPAPTPAADPLRAIAAHNAKLAAAPKLTLDALVQRPIMREVRLSPDGASIAFLLQAGQGASLNLHDVASGATRVLVKEAPRGTLSWSTDGSAIFVDDASGIHSVNLADGNVTKVASFDATRENKVLNIDLRRPRHLLASEQDRKAGTYKLFSYAADGSREQLYEGAPLRDALLDTKGRPQFIKVLAADYSQIISRRDGGGWKEVMRCKPVRPCSMVEIKPDGKRLVMLMGYQGDRTSLVEVDAASGKQRLLHSDPRALADLRMAVTDPHSGVTLSASYDLPLRRSYAVDASARRALEDIGERFASSNINLTPSAGGKRWLVAESGSAAHQPRYWLYDSASRQTKEILQAERAMGKPLAAGVLAEKHAISYRASDGKTIHGYLTLPRGANASQAPLMVLVHGGPWSRFDGEYDWLAQWLANRGVAVFQPNFRASTGYGEQYMLAAGMDFGNGRVQRDIIEGLQWLLDNGVGDKARLAIMGSSFGGYSSLLALTHTPELFQFGFATVPPPDFSRVIELASAENLAGTEDLPTSMRFNEMGISPANEAAMAALRKDAPMTGIAHVVRPLVILAGGKDEKVEISSVNEYAAKLHAAGKPVSLLVDPAEGHNPRKPIVRQAYVHLLERLLHDYLGGAAPEPCVPDLCRYLEQNLKLNNAFRK